MICVAISDRSVEKCIDTLDRCEMAEIRLDLTGFEEDQIRQVFSHKTPTIATCRPEDTGVADQLKRLTLAIEAGARYVDIEIEADKNHRNAIIAVAKKHNCRVIISYHNFNETPAIEELFRISEKCYEYGADVAKLATLAKSSNDSARILSLYSNNKPLVAIGMGEAGMITRIVGPLLGAEFTFASMDRGEATAPGQIEFQKMNEILHYLKKELTLKK